MNDFLLDFRCRQFSCGVVRGLSQARIAPILPAELGAERGRA